MTRLPVHIPEGEEAVRALISLSRVRGDRDPDDQNASALAFAKEWHRPASEAQQIRQRGQEVRDVASLAGDLQRNVIPRDEIVQAQTRVANLIDLNTHDVVSSFVPVVGTRAFRRLRTPRTLYAAIYLQLEARILQGKRLHVCERKICHGIFMRDDQRSQTYCSRECEEADYYQNVIIPRRRAARQKGKKA